MMGFEYKVVVTSAGPTSNYYTLICLWKQICHAELTPATFHIITFYAIISNLMS